MLEGTHAADALTLRSAGVVRRPRHRPAPRHPGARGRPRRRRGDAGRRDAARLRPAGAGHRVASRRCRRSAAWCARTARCTRRCTRSGRWPTAGGLDEAVGPGQRAVVVGGGLLGLQVARALTVRGVRDRGGRGRRAPAVLPARRRRRPGPGPRPAPARHRGLHRRARGPADRRGAAARQRLRARHRPRRAHRRRPALDRARPPGRADGPPRGRRRLRACASVTDERIHAIGDCAEHRGRTTGFVPPAWEQAGVLADRPLPASDAAYDGSRSVARLRATGLDVAVLGDPEHADGEVVEMTNPIAGSHRKLVVARRRDRRRRARRRPLAGRADHPALRPGHRARPGRARPAAARGAGLGADRACPTTPRSAPARASAPGGSGPASSYAACRETTRATTGCGGCEPVVRRLLGEDVAVPVGLTRAALPGSWVALGGGRVERGSRSTAPANVPAPCSRGSSDPYCLPRGVRPAERVGQQAGRPDPARRRRRPGLEKAQLRRLRHPQPMQPSSPLLSRSRAAIWSSSRAASAGRSGASRPWSGFRLPGSRESSSRISPMREPHVGGGPDEGQPPQHAALEASLAAGRAVGLDQALGLVVADRRRREAAAAGDLAHRGAGLGHPSRCTSPDLNLT